MVGVTHEQAVSFLRGHSVISLVVQRDIITGASPRSSTTNTSPDRSSSFVSGSSPQRRITLDQPQSPARSAVSPASSGIQTL